MHEDKQGYLSFTSTGSTGHKPTKDRRYALRQDRRYGRIPTPSIIFAGLGLYDESHGHTESVKHRQMRMMRASIEAEE